MNYTYFYKRKYTDISAINDDEKYDVFISSYADTERITEPFQRIDSCKKVWFTTGEESLPIAMGSDIFAIKPNEDYSTIRKDIENLHLNNKRICIDATGFHIPYLLFLLRLLLSKKIFEFDILYTEPIQYKNDEKTIFSNSFYDVKQILGMAGSHVSETSNDLLIIAAGYDHSRIIDVSNYKKSSKKVLLLGFPSMSPGMFQENIIRAYNAENAIETICFKDLEYNIYAPAYDPFVAAQTIKEYVDAFNQRGRITNLYMAPLSSKPHALGMGLYFLYSEGWKKSMSIIYPMCHEYITDTAIGISRIWKYHFQFPNEKE